MELAKTEEETVVGNAVVATDDEDGCRSCAYAIMAMTTTTTIITALMPVLKYFLGVSAIFTFTTKVAC